MYYFHVFNFFLLGCVSQFLNAAPSSGNLPFEVDMNSGNTGIDTAGSENTDNGLTAQASEQGENFVDSPKPADISQGFSLNSEPETSASKTNNKPTKIANTATSSSRKPVSSADSASIKDSAAKKERKPSSQSPASPFIPSKNAISMFEDPFFAYALQEFFRQQQLLMSLLSSDFMGMGMPSGQFGTTNPIFPFGGSSLQMPTFTDLQQSFNIDNMELIEDRVIDDKKGKGHLQTYKTKDGSAVIQTVAYSQMHENNGISTLPGEQTTIVPATKSFRTRSSRGASPAKIHSPRRIRVH